MQVCFLIGLSTQSAISLSIYLPDAHVCIHTYVCICYILGDTYLFTCSHAACNACMHTYVLLRAPQRNASR